MTAAAAKPKSLAQLLSQPTESKVRPPRSPNFQRIASQIELRFLARGVITFVHRPSLLEPFWEVRVYDSHANRAAAAEEPEIRGDEFVPLYWISAEEVATLIAIEQANTDERIEMNGV